MLTTSPVARLGLLLLFSPLALLACAVSPAPGEQATASASPLLGASAAQAAAPGGYDAELVFQVGWIQVQRGALVRGGHVDVTYDASRMAACPSPTIFAYAEAEPGGQIFSSDEALGFDIPSDATSVQLWFHAVSPGCEQWDSSYGQNWRFPVVAAAPAPVGWVGDWGSSTNRDCAHVSGVPQPIVIDEYLREEACIFVDADVWVPGATDTDVTHPEWISAQVQWAKDSNASVWAQLDYEGIVGHNARFRWSIPYELRSQADWTTASYAFRFSTDGVHWTYAAQPSGENWTIERAFTFSSSP